VADLAFLLELLERAHGLRVWDVLVGRVELVEVDAVGAQAAQASLDRGGDRRRAGAGRQGRAVAHAELGGDDDVVAAGAQGDAEQLLAAAAAVDVRRVEQVDPGVEGGATGRVTTTGVGPMDPPTEAIVRETVAVASELGVAPAQVALAWLLGRPGVATLVIGARDERQLDANLAAVEVELSAEERSRLDRVSAPPLLYPYWHQAKTASDRLSPADLALLGPHL
jgi:hypothetical protein